MIDVDSGGDTVLVTVRQFGKTAMGFILLFAGGALSGAAPAMEMDLMYEFQLAQLLEPSTEQLQEEREGRIFIYDGIKESDIQLALDTQIDRIGSMMFVNVIWTDESGEPLVDSVTGDVLADDDC